MKTLINRYYYSLEELADATGPGPISGVTTFDALLREINPLWAVGSQTAAEQTLFQDYLWPEYYNSAVLYVDKEQSPWEEEEEPTDEEVEEAVLPVLGRMHRWYKESSERYLYLITQLESIKSTLLGPVSVTTTGESSYSGSVSGNGSNTGTVQTSGTNGSTTTTDTTTTRLESDTPQNGGSDVFATGYVSKAAKETVDSDVVVSGNNSSTTTNNLANTNSSTNSGSADNSVIVENDVTTPIERFREVQEKLRNLYAEWADGFSRFVIYSAE